MHLLSSSAVFFSSRNGVRQLRARKQMRCHYIYRYLSCLYLLKSFYLLFLSLPLFLSLCVEQLNLSEFSPLLLNTQLAGNKRPDFRNIYWKTFVISKLTGSNRTKWFLSRHNLNVSHTNPNHKTDIDNDSCKRKEKPKWYTASEAEREKKSLRK